MDFMEKLHGIQHGTIKKAFAILTYKKIYIAICRQHAVSDTASIFFMKNNIVNEVLCAVQKALWLYVCLYSSNSIVWLFFPFVAFSE